MANALSDQERELMDAYWRAANYLSVGQIKSRWPSSPSPSGRTHARALMRRGMASISCVGLARPSASTKLQVSLRFGRDASGLYAPPPSPKFAVSKMRSELANVCTFGPFAARTPTPPA
jgi:hypothetical protein